MTAKLISPFENYVPSAEVFEPIDYYTDEELAADKGAILVYDVESFPNYFLIGFKNIYTGKVVTFEIFEDEVTYNPMKLVWVLHNFTIVGFNSIQYDIIVTWLSTKGVSSRTLFDATQDIIVSGERSFFICKKYGFEIGFTNHIDIINVAPLDASLKIYGGRLHCKKMQDLPYEPTMELTRQQMHAVKIYNINDLDNTALLFIKLIPQIDLRCDLGSLYQIDLRSKSDAQIAEHVIASELNKISGVTLKRAEIPPGTVFNYTAPSFITYETPQLQEALKVVESSNFVISEKGKVITPHAMERLIIKLGSSKYKLQIGGLHSQEKQMTHVAGNRYIMGEVDVSSYYPAIILNLGLYPQSMGPDFLEVYKSLVDRRLEAKAKKHKDAHALKITINGCFGKLGNRYSRLYSPDLLINVTITGQLSLLKLIEMLELNGVPVISANTDGVVFKCNYEDKHIVDKVVKQWEELTKFNTEETLYKSLHCRDVNNYFAFPLDEDDKVKVKGCYSEKGSALNSVLSKNPENLICSDAVIAFIKHGKPIKETILECKDIRRFLSVRTVKGGAVKDGHYLGKAIRWYHRTGNFTPIVYAGSGNMVPKSNGTYPLMTLPDKLPGDINYDYYIQEAQNMLEDIGYYGNKETMISFF